MKKHFGESKAQRQAAYMQAFESLVTAADKRHAGRIEWASAQHFFFIGKPVEEAAALYLANRLED